MAGDYYRAVAQVEKGLELAAESAPAPAPLTTDERTHLLTLANQLADPNLRLETRLNLIEQMRWVLIHPVSQQVVYMVAE